jgi:hypothetical protein
MKDANRRDGEPPNSPSDRYRVILCNASEARKAINRRALAPEAAAYELQAALIEVIKSSRGFNRLRDDP